MGFSHHTLYLLYRFTEKKPTYINDPSTTAHILYCKKLSSFILHCCESRRTGDLPLGVLN